MKSERAKVFYSFLTKYSLVKPENLENDDHILINLFRRIKRRMKHRTSLERIFVDIDRYGDEVLPSHEFGQGLSQIEIYLTEEEMRLILATFSSDGESIHYKKFVEDFIERKRLDTVRKLVHQSSDKLQTLPLLKSNKIIDLPFDSPDTRVKVDLSSTKELQLVTTDDRLRCSPTRQSLPNRTYKPSAPLSSPIRYLSPSSQRRPQSAYSGLRTSNEQRRQKPTTSTRADRNSRDVHVFRSTLPSVAGLS